jgi:hypothetical protein
MSMKSNRNNKAAIKKPHLSGFFIAAQKIDVTYSTNSIKALGALSPGLKPAFKVRV